MGRNGQPLAIFCISGGRWLPCHGVDDVASQGSDAQQPLRTARSLLRNFGLKVGIVGVVGFEQRIHDLVEGVPELADIMEPLLAARRVLREKFAKLHRKVLLLARDNEVCQRLMTIPGVGPVVSLAFISTVDVPARFRNSKAVGPSLGLTPVLNQSGESHRVGRVSLCGDEAMRALLYGAAQVMLTRVQKWSWLKAWAMNIAKRRGQKKAIVALARRLAVIMHRMWSDGTVPLDKGNGADNLSDERQTVGATIQRNDVPRGTMDETSSLWTLVSIALPRSVREVRLFRLFLLIPCWESQRLIPKRSAGPRATKIGVVSLKALDHPRPNREGLAWAVTQLMPCAFPSRRTGDPPRTPAVSDVAMLS